jgi:hypothetical protein
METRYPWDGVVRLKLDPKGSQDLGVRLRLPPGVRIYRRGRWRDSYRAAGKKWLYHAHRPASRRCG